MGSGNGIEGVALLAGRCHKGSRAGRWAALTPRGAGDRGRGSDSDSVRVGVPRYGGHLMAFVVVAPVEAVGKGAGAPFSTTPQAGRAEAERRA